ncbi:hypothetical protein ABT124_46740 [Streptomyces sp. NPDC001982]|uniref:hypothetical protein n=1 Tax=Streptomyces sp. NPDC001982 TaxID=3154405 RepID=UPI00331D0073
MLVYHRVGCGDGGDAFALGDVGDADVGLGPVVAVGFGVEGRVDVGLGAGDVGGAGALGDGGVADDVGLGAAVVVAVGSGVEGRVDIGFGGGDGAGVVLRGVSWDCLLDGDGDGCRERGVAVGVGFGVCVDVGCAWPDGVGRGVPCGATNAQMPMPPRTSTATPPAIHGASWRVRR